MPKFWVIILFISLITSHRYSSLPSAGVRALKYYPPDTRTPKKRSLLFEVLLMNLTTLPPQCFLRSFVIIMAIHFIPLLAPQVSKSISRVQIWRKRRPKFPVYFSFSIKGLLTTHRIINCMSRCSAFPETA